jgi:hypothetical protein
VPEEEAICIHESLRFCYEVSHALPGI